MPRPSAGASDPLAIDPELTRKWLVEFLRDELTRRRKFGKAVIGLSGGVDSALVTFLAVEALGRDNVTAVRMPYRTSSPESLAHAQLVIDQLGIPAAPWTSPPASTASCRPWAATPPRRAAATSWPGCA
ncbi:MAG: 7-cyano-7-deazaguanine synthase [Gemmatimonadetes bacterium]|nr:7-cyano-7-deazaguanine synthase [Gemmatimonadota bacterium]